MVLQLEVWAWGKEFLTVKNKLVTKILNSSQGGVDGQGMQHEGGEQECI
jgi:hypothetical protein